MQAFREFKALWDPEMAHEPGKLVEPYRMDENLKVHPDLKVWQPPTHFQFPDDHGSMAHATLRCVGVGKCRREEGGVMCPSHQSRTTKKHSTRGRAPPALGIDEMAMFFKQKQLNATGAKNPSRIPSISASPAKAAKSDCPVGVDVADYKAEFLSHYYDGRSRPLRDYAFGNVDIFARLASYTPGLANLFTQLPGDSAMREVSRGSAETAPHPAFAPETFRAWFRRQLPQNQGAPQVILWADTFNNYFHPETAQAAVGSSKPPASRFLFPKPTSAAAAPSTTSACSIAPSASCSTRLMSSNRS